MSKNSMNTFSDGVKKIAEDILNPAIKVVSFDVFDTLLLRPVLTPADTFRLLENKLNIPNFHNMRVTAETEARKSKSVYIQDITLDDIYNAYSEMFHADKEEVEALKEEELKCEYTMLYERKSAKFLFEQAKNANKQIIIISDMYLSSGFLDKVLRKNGYEGYTHIYVSSETGMLKSSKQMYYQVLSDLEIQDVKSQEVLHIGDNKKSDVDCAIATGMNARHLPKAVDLKNNCRQLRRTYDFILQDVMNSNNAILYGFLLNKYFDDPFVNFDNNSYFNGDAKLMGYWFSPLLIGFEKWLIEGIEKREIEQLLWVWRDGYLPSKLFEIMRPYFSSRPVETKKIYMGRDLRMPFSSLDTNGLFHSLSDTPINKECSVDYFITNRMLCMDDIQYEEILAIFIKHGYLNAEAEIGPIEKYRGFIYELEPYFVENAKSKIKLYGGYIKQTIDSQKRIAVFDRSPRGKSSRFLKQYFDVNSVCFTTEVYDTPKAKLKDIDCCVERYLEYGKSHVNRMGGIWAQLFEIIISDRMPGFKDITQNVDGTYNVQLNETIQSEWEQRTDTIVFEIQNAIIEFVDSFVQTLNEYIRYIVIDRHGVFDFAIEALCVPYIKDARLIKDIFPGSSALAPLDEKTFINWYNRKIKGIESSVNRKKRPYDYIRHAGYVTAEKLGILLPARTLYRNIIHDPLEPVVSLEKLQTITDVCISKINILDCTKINALFLGGVPQEMGVFFNELARLMEGLHFVFEASGFVKLPVWFHFPCIVGPEHLSFWGIEGQDIRIKVTEEIKNTVRSKPYLSDLVKRRMLCGYSESISIVLAYEAERYFTALIEKINPRLLMVWNNWGKNSVVPTEIAKRKGIPTVSVERGFMEGTIMFSRNGYGKDMVNAQAARFCALSVSDKELQSAQKILDFQKNTGFNRYYQPVNDNLERLRQKTDNGNPNILLVGGFDCENPAFPLNDVSKELYAPTFATSKEAVLHVAKLARKNKWNCIFKPHPLMDKIVYSKSKSKFPNNVFYIREGNINDLIDMADVVVCMISGVSYIALIHEKPLVQLGYTPLKEKGCCYEAGKISEIEEKIKEALRQGYTDGQKKAFIKHVAQVNKYYYFDDLTARPIRYGRPIQEAVDFLNNMVNERGVI